MKILLVNWSWYPTGGDWTYVDNVRALYEMHGHQVIPLSTVNDKNIPAKQPAYFTSSPDYKQLNKNKNLVNSYKAVKNSIVSSEALKKVEQALAENDIQIAHLHNIHHYITPAIIWKLKKAGVKVIWSLHDYKIICPESLFISNGKICEKCIKGNFFNCALNKCKKNSFAASTLASIEAFFYHKSGIYNKVDAYLCPSAFLKNKFRNFGFDDSRLFVSNLCYDISLIDNFIKNYSAAPTEKYILYVGRIEQVKGVRTLINAVKGTAIKLKIAGTGAADKELKELVATEKINNVEFLGFQSKESVFELTLHSKFVVCPSEWYENFPYSIIESFLFSKPVVGSTIGGIPELVQNGETGYLFEAGNVNDLQEKLTTLWNDDVLIREMGLKARQHVYDIVNFEKHWTKLNFVINSILNNGN
ncbi:MAG: glycosyltransferase family 4 protein [Bacteroidetes bacterium]|nr:glycosyltransferase family 4 protein [Bacteroidota bacterium]